MPVLAPAPIAQGAPIGVFVLMLLVAAGAVAVGFWFEHQRRDTLRTLAATHGWRFRPGRVDGLERRFPGFERLQQGRDRHAKNLIEGERGGRALFVFDYHYTTGSGKHRKRHAFTAVVLETELRLDPLRIRREHALDALTAAFGFDDIDFESTAFSDRFHVSSPNREWAYTVIHPETMAFLLDAPDHPVELHTRHAFSYGSGRLDPNGIRDAIRVLEGVVDRIPADVRARRALGAPVS